jgi:acyl-coenzyme A synthetase/AMP-(fatty) acid ligase
LKGECSGFLCIKNSWPGSFRTLFGDHDRYETTYFKPFKGYYFSGDGCNRDKDGYYWLTGRVDDVINVSGHRIGTAEVESALVSHPHCAEAAVVGVEHEVKGQNIYAFVTLNEDEIVLADPTTNPKRQVATQLVLIEKKMLNSCLAAVYEIIDQLPDLAVTPCPSPYSPILK